MDEGYLITPLSREVDLKRRGVHTEIYSRLADKDEWIAMRQKPVTDDIFHTAGIQYPVANGIQYYSNSM